MSIVVQIQRFLQPADAESSQAQALRILNERYNVSQDLSTLAQAVEDARTHREQLEHTLAQSKDNLAKVISQTQSAAAAHLHTAQELSLLRHSLTDELSSLTSELLSSFTNPDGRPTLLEDIETMHRNLKEQESIKAYVQVIHRALQLSEESTREVQHTRPVTISAYQSLQAFVASVTDACAKVVEVTGQADTTLRVVSFLNEVQKKTWVDMKGALSALLLAEAEKLNWPLPVDLAKTKEEDRRTFSAAFLDLSILQELGESLHSGNSAAEKEGLYAMQALIQPVAQRFKYHFEGTRQTNKLDKPEWYFTHILNVSHEHQPFLETFIQTLLASTKYRDVVAWREFTYNLLPIVARHLKRSMPSLLPHAPLLAHTIYQALAFDASLREDGFSLAGTLVGRANKDADWEGVSAVVLGRKEWFERWMDGEKEFALDQYHEIISAPDAWTIVDDEPNVDGAPPPDTHPTISARRLKSLVEQVTDRYSPLPQFTQRTRFLINVQLPLLEQYHGRISSSLDAFESLSSAFARAVPGALGTSASEGKDRGHLTSGTEGVMRLCKALVSAKTIAVAMEGWGEDLFFLELWAEINHKASLRARAETHPSLPDPKALTDGTEAPDGTIFEELVQQYGTLVARAEDMIVQQVCGEVETSLKPYFSQSARPSSASRVATPVADLAVSPALVPALSILSAHLSFLRRTVSRATVAGVYRRLATRLAAHILQRAILQRRARRVSPAEGRLVQGECALWVETCRAALPGARVDAPWRALREAAAVVGADGARWAALVDAAFGAAPGDDAWRRALGELVGVDGAPELAREDVCVIARTRADCDR
ncbi:hypothetical protein FA95DRAFT_1540756 [Auriscalpium vulgare]|uniref:Uncharacterized protein n=1 Tax=Auriscalpium vulgare TaxID=40419 RepID=A0ACB8RUJ1_9AGAM|nr:hypothetical protein FA95DRAFT_1540756 [Auriscalpium vulgare]